MHREIQRILFFRCDVGFVNHSLEGGDIFIFVFRQMNQAGTHLCFFAGLQSFVAERALARCADDFFVFVEKHDVVVEEHRFGAGVFNFDSGEDGFLAEEFSGMPVGRGFNDGPEFLFESVFGKGGIGILQLNVALDGFSACNDGEEQDE